MIRRTKKSTPIDTALARARTLSPEELACAAGGTDRDVAPPPERYKLKPVYVSS